MKPPPASAGYWFVLDAFLEGTIHVYFNVIYADHAKEVHQMLIDNKYDADIRFSGLGKMGRDEMEITVRGHLN